MVAVGADVNRPEVLLPASVALSIGSLCVKRTSRICSEIFVVDSHAITRHGMPLAPATLANRTTVFGVIAVAAYTPPRR
jgi:hypothetical protein